MTPEQIEQLQTKGICSFFIRNISKICGENEKKWSVIWQIPTHTCTYINKHSAVCTKSTHIYNYTMYTCICPLYMYQKIRGSLTQNELLKLFLYKSVQQTTTSFLVSWAAPVNSERASYYIIRVFCISTN